MSQIAAVLFLLLPLLASGQTKDAPRTRNPHGSLPMQCEGCHTASGWTPIRQHPEFDHNTQTAYPLRGMHASVACRSCHINLAFKNVGTACSSCHADLHRGQLGANCDQCHSVKGWIPASQMTNVQHDGRFPLIGAHAHVTCEGCHPGAASAIYTGLSTECIACHRNDFASTQNPPHQAAGFPIDCSVCHSINAGGWLTAKFDHNTFAHFPLTGAHITVACNACHINGRFAGTPTTCEGCHMPDFQATTNPPHAAAGFATNCQLCHTTASWLTATVDHSTFGFPLTGAHTTVACTACHKNNQFVGTPTTCVGCHLADFQSTNNPSHTNAAFSTDCTQCHTTATWANAVFDHSKTQFPLTGAHVTLQCNQCHTSGAFASTPKNCDACHIAQFNATTNPNHVQAGFPVDCSICHTTTTFATSSFDHNAASGFPLTGTHATTSCAQCHVAGNFSTLPRNCDGCHLPEYKSTTNPNHVQAAFPLDCSICHSTTNWLNAVFDHSKTPFPLTGAHTTVACTQCHVNNVFAGTPTNCDACHIALYNSTTNPNHAASGFPVDCSICHSTTNWTSATFNHSNTPFPLTGAHTTVACNLCHVNNVFNGTPTACNACHITDYNGANNPNHVAAGFGTDCATCHSTTNWTSAVFDHSKTPFPLTGAHTTLQCNQCHNNTSFSTTPANCNACHMSDYNGTTNPNHVLAAFPLDCSICHSTTDWSGAVFDHSKTPFPLTGAHTTVACTQCHVNNVFAGTPTNCDACHIALYNSTTNPNHVSAGFPLDCSICHSTTDWTSATFNHSTTPFPLTGAHTTVACNLCHVNNVFNGTPTACSACHITDYNGATNPNHVAAGFGTDCAT